MLLTVRLLNKGSFLGSLINKCRPATVANLSVSSPSYSSKTLEEEIGLPPKPKKPLSTYFRFMKEERGKILSRNPQLPAIEVIKKLSKEWHSVDTSVKQRLLEEYKKDQQKYIEARVKYDSQITDEQRSQLKDLKRKKIVAKEKRIMSKRIKELGRPKKPSSAFLRFLADQRIASPQTSKESYKDWQQRVSKKWTALSEDQKEVYTKEVRNDMEKYKKEVSLWEEKMIRSGHVDVIRQSNLVEYPENKPKKLKT